MKRIAISALVVAVLAGAFALSGGQKAGPKTDLQVSVEARNPWTHLKVNDEPELFHFAVMTDRTGGNRGRVFSQAVEQINMMQPTFVVCVGDLIQGYSKDKTILAKQWKELQTYTSKLQMPFFYVPGNHDMANPVEAEEWKERFGRTYYHFLYKDVLFLAANSDDPSENKENGKLSKEQIEYFQKVLKDNPNVRWTFVLVHKPIWTHSNLDKNGWLELEKALADRKYTVFAGHVHRYQKFVRQGMNYYQLATTGGGSKMRGVRYGEFDHIAWVTVKTKTEPIIANLMLDGIYGENMKQPISDEPGVPILNRKAVHPVHGKVLFDGVPATDAQIVFWRADEKDKTGKKFNRIADAFVEPDGTYSMSTYVPNDGLQEGDYRVTVTRRKLLDEMGKLGPNLFPEKYSTPLVSELRATVKTGTNDLDLELTSK